MLFTLEAKHIKFSASIFHKHYSYSYITNYNYTRYSVILILEMITYKNSS